MANNLQVSKIILNEVLMDLGNRLYITKNMDNSYTKEFGNKDRVVGDTISARRPQRFLFTEGLAYQPQPIDNITIPITVDSTGGVHMEWDTIDLTLNDVGLSEKYAKPASLAISNAINAKAARFIALNTANAAGTPGTIPNTVTPYLEAGDRIIEQGLAQNEDLVCAITRRMSSVYVAGQTTLFNPAAVIGKQYLQGQFQNALGYDFVMDQGLLTQTTGNYGAGSPVVSGTQSGTGAYTSGQTLSITGFPANATFVAGDRFTIGSGTTAVNSVNPQTKLDNRRLQEFVITQAAQADGAGAVTLNIFPSITPSGVYQNVTQAALNNATINMIGAGNTVHTQALLYHKQAFAFMCVPMANPDPRGVEVSLRETDPETGITVSFVRQFDGVQRKWINRFDVLFGFARLNAELASVVYA